MTRELRWADGTPVKLLAVSSATGCFVNRPSSNVERAPDRPLKGQKYPVEKPKRKGKWISIGAPKYQIKGPGAPSY